MSLGIVIKAPEGIVLAAESRLTLTVNTGTVERPVSAPAFFDNAHKVLNFQAPHNFVGAVTYGLGAIGLRTAFSYLPELEETFPNGRQTVETYAQLISDFFLAQWNAAYPSGTTAPGQGMTFVVGGFNIREPYGHVYLIDIPSRPAPLELYVNQFGVTWGGQREIVDRILNGYDEKVMQKVKERLNLSDDQLNQLKVACAPFQLQTPVQFFALQDCVDLAIFFIRTTIEAQSLSVGLRGVGGPIDLAVITRTNPFKYIQEKALKGQGPKSF